MKPRNILNVALIVAGGAAIYWWLISWPLPLPITLGVRYGVFSPCIFALLYSICCKYAGKHEQAVSFILICILFALPLNILWTLGISDEVVIGGLLPYSDAQGYYYDAKLLLQGDHFSGFSTRRPFFASYLASLLFITGDNLRNTVALLTFITACSVFLATREVRKQLGRLASVLFLFVVFIFYRRFIGTTLTEHLGVAFGTLGMTFILQTSFCKRYQTWLTGLFLLTIALCARAGLFMVLPALLCWGVYYFRSNKRKASWLLFYGSLVIAAGFLLNQAMVKMVGDPNGSAFSNFSYTLYGLVNNSNWSLAVENPPPEVIGLTGKAFTDMLYSLALRAIVDNPMLLVKGALRAIIEFSATFFGFVYYGHVPVVSTGYWSNNKLNLLLLIYKVEFERVFIYTCYILFIVGLLRNLRRDSPQPHVLWFIGAGFLISIPFAPPWDGDYGRVYAATIPLLALFPAYGVKMGHAEVGKLTAKAAVNFKDSNPMVMEKYSFLLYAVASLLLFLSVVMPLYLRTFSVPAVQTITKSNNCEQPVYLDMKKGTYLMLQQDDFARAMSPLLNIDDFRWNMLEMNLHYPKFTEELQHIPVDALLFLVDDKYIWIEKEKMVSSGAGQYCAIKISEGNKLFAADYVADR